MGYKDPDKQREFQREWMRKRRQKWIDKNGPCRQCGSSVKLEVDHIDPDTKLLNPARLWSLSEAKRNAELAKCQVLCGACHYMKTIEYSSSLSVDDRDRLHILGNDIGWSERQLAAWFNIGRANVRRKLGRLARI